MATYSIGSCLENPQGQKPGRLQSIGLHSQTLLMHTYFKISNRLVFKYSHHKKVVMYGCESWTVKKPEHRRIDAFELWCWRKLLRVPWTARRSNQSILKEVNPGISLEE